MYIGSAAFRAANARPFQKHRITGTIDSLPFTSGNILSNSLSIVWQSSDASDARIGAVYVTSLKVTFIKNISIPERSWHGRKITVNAGLCIDEVQNIYEDFPLGVFTVSEANITPDGVTVTAYDDMQKLDKALPDGFVASGTMYSIAAQVCQACGVEFGMDPGDVADLPNGTEILGSYVPNDLKTYRDVIYWLSVTAGGWATFDASGALIIATYPHDTILGYEITESTRLNGASFSDFITLFGAATFENDDGTTQTIGSPGVGTIYDVGFNPFLQYGTQETKNRMRSAVATAIFNIHYMPFKIGLMSAPIFNLGDILYLSGGIIDTMAYHGIVQRITYQAGRGVTLEGFGQDPALQNISNGSGSGKSAQQSAIVSELIYKRFENPIAYEIESDAAEPQKVVEINFTTTKQTDVEIWHEIQLETDLDFDAPNMTVTAAYFLDGVEMARHPVETFTDDGKHIVDLHFETPIEVIGSHVWEVYLETSGGAASIRENDILALLKGQGIAKGDAWTGVIILDDEFPAVDIITAAETFTDSAVVSLQVPERIQAADSVPAFSMAFFMFEAITENISISMQIPTFVLLTEDGTFAIMTEDEQYILETE